MLAYTYNEKRKFTMKEKPALPAPTDAIVRVMVNVEAVCGECFFCKKGYVNSCIAPDDGWALGCRIDGGQAAMPQNGSDEDTP